MSTPAPRSVPLPPLSQLTSTSRPIKLVAFDFDLTLLTDHTYGRHSGPASSLLPLLRPTAMRLLKEAAEARGVRAAVVTSSMQVDMIKVRGGGALSV